MSYDKEGRFLYMQSGSSSSLYGIQDAQEKGWFFLLKVRFIPVKRVRAVRISVHATRGQIQQRQIQVNENFDKYRKRSLANVTSQYGTVLRVNRSIQAEGCFRCSKRKICNSQDF